MTEIPNNKTSQGNLFRLKQPGRGVNPEHETACFSHLFMLLFMVFIFPLLYKAKICLLSDSQNVTEGFVLCPN